MLLSQGPNRALCTASLQLTCEASEESAEGLLSESQGRGEWLVSCDLMLPQFRFVLIMSHEKSTHITLTLTLALT